MSAPLRVAVIADYAEEEWPSMDLVAEMLMAHLAAEHRGTVAGIQDAVTSHDCSPGAELLPIPEVCTLST